MKRQFGKVHHKEDPQKMKKVIFITGATGFLGTNLVKGLKLREYKHVYCLGRKGNSTIRGYTKQDNFTFVGADILDVHRYAKFMTSTDVVVHIAAQTGKATKSEYFRVNTEGTECLVNQCIRQGVKRFLYISTIAAQFRDTSCYYYAQSKVKAEAIVKAGDLQYTIIRPTIIVGKGASILDSLLLLAKAPLVPVFGDGLTTIQPVYVDDVVRFILDIIKNDRFENKSIDIGGPERISMVDFIRQIHDLSYAKAFRPVYLPISPLRGILRVLERIALPVLPFTAGQLTSFTNDGVASTGVMRTQAGTRYKTVDEMLLLSLSPRDRATNPSANLTKECRVLTHYMIGAEPDGYICEKYRQGHECVIFEDDDDVFDVVLTKAVRRCSYLTILVDVYSAVFRRNGLFRKKLILLLAVLESYAPTYKQIDSVSVSSRSVLYLMAIKEIVTFSAALLLSVLAFGPFNLLCRLRVRVGKVLSR